MTVRSISRRIALGVRGISPHPRRCGQAMAETVVASLALVAVVLCVPMIGKLWDLSHAALASARYGVWERTAWFDTGAGLSPAAEKKDKTIQTEIVARTVSSPRHPSAPPVLWRDHTGQPLLALTEYTGPEHLTPGPVYKVLGPPIRWCQKIGSSLGFEVCQRLPPTVEGYFRGYARLALNAPAYPEEVAKGPLEAVAPAALLTRSWSSSGPDLTWDRTKGLVPAQWLQRPLALVWKLLGPSFEFFFPDFEGTGECVSHRGPPDPDDGPRGGLCPGFIDPRPVPADRKPPEPGDS